MYTSALELPERLQLRSRAQPAHEPVCGLLGAGARGQQGDTDLGHDLVHAGLERLTNILVRPGARRTEDRKLTGHAFKRRSQRKG